MKHILVAIIFTLLAAPCFAEVVVTEEIDYFKVTGKTKQEIYRSLHANSPIKKKKTFAAATTKSQLRYEIVSEKRNGRCGVTKTKILLHLTYTYPRLVQTPASGVRAWWQEQLRAYEKHELTHGDIAKRFAEKLESELSRMHDLNCGTMKTVVDDRFRYYNRKMNQAQAEFDRKEQHK